MGAFGGRQFDSLPSYGFHLYKLKSNRFLFTFSVVYFFIFLFGYIQCCINMNRSWTDQTVSMKLISERDHVLGSTSQQGNLE